MPRRPAPADPEAFPALPRDLPPDGDRETIVALATPPGEGALSVIRLSGPRALAVGQRLFRGRQPLSALASRTTHLGRLHHPEDGRALDQVMAQVMRAPRSFTGEDVVEFTGHGGRLAARLAVEAALAAGARPAEPGEFSRRAFLNGRIDLAQAEAVADLIAARGERALRNALQQLEGGLSRRIGALRDQALGLLAPLEAFIDFGDDVPVAPGAAALRQGLAALARDIEALLGGRERARLLSEGATVALVGRPNVGKSSLLNALSGQDRALVHETPGTTRDLVDIELSLEGIPVRLVDTAGIRRTEDPVESAGVDRARRVAGSARLALFVLDGSRPPAAEDRDALALLDAPPTLVLRNKSDAGDDPGSAAFAAGLGAPVLSTSARTGQGVAELRARIAQLLGQAAGAEEDVLMTRARHYDALTRARAAFARADDALAAGAFADMVAAELREGLTHLGEITGEAAAPDILDRIFQTFCIGK